MSGTRPPRPWWVTGAVGALLAALAAGRWAYLAAGRGDKAELVWAVLWSAVAVCFLASALLQRRSERRER